MPELVKPLEDATDDLCFVGFDLPAASADTAIGGSHFKAALTRV
jgi:hypothetical protein